MAELLAAVDLGSNSFHMVVAERRGRHIRVVDRARDRVRLAAGLDQENNLEDSSVEAGSSVSSVSGSASTGSSRSG